MQWGDVAGRAAKLTDDHLREIGRVMVAWGVLENQVNAAIGTCLRITLGQALAVITPLRSFKQRQIILLQVFKETFDAATVAKFLEINTLIDKLYGVRNRVAHGLWGVYDEFGEEMMSVEFKLRDKKENDWLIHKRTVDELRFAADAMTKAAKQLGLLMHTLRPPP